MTVPAENILESSRDIVQDFLVPELKAVKVSIEGLTHQIESIRTEMKLREEKMEQLIRSGESRMELVIRSGLEKIQQEVHFGDQKNAQMTESLSQKFDERMEFRERLAALEALMPRH